MSARRGITTAAVALLLLAGDLQGGRRQDPGPLAGFEPLRCYHSTSVADILRESGTNSGSLYHFFATNQDLLVGVLERYRDGIHPMLLEPAWQGVDDPVKRVFALLDGYRRLLVESDYRLGCPIGDIAPFDAAVGRFRDYLERPGAVPVHA